MIMNFTAPAAAEPTFELKACYLQRKPATHLKGHRCDLWSAGPSDAGSGQAWVLAALQTQAAATAAVVAAIQHLPVSADTMVRVV